MASFVELTIEQGANFSTDLDLRDSSGSLLNISGYSVASQMRKSYYSTSANNFTMTITDGSAGQITMSMNSSNTSNIVPGRYVYDILLRDGQGVKTRIIEGIVTVLPSVTR